MADQLFFEDFEEGQRFPSPSKTITDAHFLAFAALTGDNHPIHYDLEYCRAHGWPERLAHGLLCLAQTVLGASELAHKVHESRAVFLEQSSKFLLPVFIGDTLYPAMTVSSTEPKRSAGVVRMRVELHNQRKELVLEGEHVYLIRRRNPLPKNSPA